MSGENIAAISTLVTALVAAFASALVLILNTRAHNRQRAQKDKLDEFERLLERYEKQIARQDVQIENHQSLLQRSLELNALLREKNASIRGKYESLHAYAQKLYEILERHDLTVEKMQLPKDPSPSSDEIAQSESVDLDARKVEQASSIIRRLNPRPPAEEKSKETRRPLEGEGQEDTESGAL